MPTKSAEEVITDLHNGPVGVTIEPVVAALRAQPEIWVPTQGSGNGGELSLKVASDNQGRDWLYLYTSERELNDAFPEGTTYAAMSFDDAFELVSKDPRFGGISINHSEAKRYMIPRELFERVKR